MDCCRRRCPRDRRHRHRVRRTTQHPAHRRRGRGGWSGRSTDRGPARTKALRPLRGQDHRRARRGARTRPRLAVDSRRSDDTLVIARTDALAVRGLGDAVERGRAFAAAGADVVFVEAIETVDQLAAIAAALPSTPLVYNAVEGGRSPTLDPAVLARAGVRILIHPVTLLLEKIPSAAGRARRDQGRGTRDCRDHHHRVYLSTPTGRWHSMPWPVAPRQRVDPSARRIAVTDRATPDEGELDVVLRVGGVDHPAPATPR